jgi:hypothetical protein
MLPLGNKPFDSSSSVRKAAPLMLLVGPLEKVRMGNRDAISPDMTVPSFCVMNTGQVIPSSRTGF